ncbi:tyrosine--tRNA ligase [Candidatus Peregrinibacteria bacterium CG10_big_fil_rev_8_21_14_0_10_49_10]|nr:MAG: tyrosine--tRNA ligase [Candidatus Peregrinibacteria bacterium CG10_big_fil_rev_8_21_14_0_10_49_10]
MKNDELLTRGVSNVTPKDLAEKKLKSGKPIRLYLGIDPTGSKLHLGHSVPLRKLKAFQEAGHEVIFLVGSFTAMIGDPSGRDKQREALTEEQVEENFQTYKDQASKILDFRKVQLRYNHEWLESLTVKELAGLATHFTVQQMLERDMFQERMKKGNPIAILEFLYPLMVGYDSVVLDVDLEVGGNDQYFNLLAGRTLQTALGKRDKFVLTTKLIEGTDGRKMSKTYNNCIYLDDEPRNMFGKVMSVQDILMETYFECCTDVPMSEVQQILGGEPRDAKARLAREIVTLYHGESAAFEAENAFTKVFSRGELPDDMSEIKVKKGSMLLDVLVSEGLIASKSDARRLVEQGGIKLNNTPVASIEAQAEEGVVTIGKRKFVRLRF